MIHEYNPETKKYSQIIVKNITEKESNDKVWSIGANEGLSEINSYMLTLQEAIDMIKPAIEEDGYSENDLYIFRNIQEPEAVDNDLYPLYFKIYTHDVPMGFRMNLKKSGVWNMYKINDWNMNRLFVTYMRLGHNDLTKYLSNQG